MRVVRASLRSCAGAERHPRRLLDTPGAEPILSAPRRGGAVRSYSTTSFPVKERVPVCSNVRHALGQDKFIVADDTDVQAGRLNRTSSATQRNAESLLVVRNAPALVAWRGVAPAVDRRY